MNIIYFKGTEKNLFKFIRKNFENELISSRF